MPRQATVTSNSLRNHHTSPHLTHHFLDTRGTIFPLVQCPVGTCSKRVNATFEGMSGTCPVTDDIKVQGATEIEHDFDLLEPCE